MIRMINLLGIAVVAAIPVSAVPAHAAEGGECITGQLSDQVEAEFFASYRARQQPTGPLLERLTAALQHCSRTHRWNAAQAEAARRLTVARILHERLLLESPFSADQLSRLNAAFDTLDPETIQRWVDQGIPDSDHPRLSALLASAGVTVDERSGEFVGEYMAARHLLASTTAAFAAS